MRPATAANRDSIVAELRRATAYPPTLRELASSIGLSTTRVQQLVDVMIADGVLVREPGKARTLRVK